MAKFDYPSRYWADDKDVADLLSQAKFSHAKLLQLARRRGIFLSKQLPKETIIEYLSMLPFNWEELIGLLHAIETESKEPQLASKEIEADIDLQVIEAAVRDVRDLRGQMKSEAYQIHTSGETVYITANYQEVNPASTRMLQWTDQKVEIQITKNDSKVQIRHGATDRGAEITDALVKALQPKEGPHAPVHYVSLEHISSHEKRNEFFRKVIHGLDGLRPENVKDLRLNKLSVDDDGKPTLETHEISLDEGLEHNGQKGTNHESPVATVRRTVLSGDSLLQAPEFHSFIAKGFFISRAVWTAIEKDGKGRKFEFEAEFRDPEKASRFTYKPRGFWDRDDDGQLVLKKADAKLDDRRILIEKIENAAKRALADITASDVDGTEPILPETQKESLQ